MLDVACNLVVFSENPLLLGVKEKEAVEFKVKPNPTTGVVDIMALGELSSQESVIQLFDLTGTLVGNYDWNGQSTRLDLSGQSKGIYILAIRTEDKTEMHKLVVQ